MKRAPFEGGDSGEHARLSLTELKARLAENASRIDAMMDSMSEEELQALMKSVEDQMLSAAKALDFEKAAKLRDQLFELKGESGKEQQIQKPQTRRRWKKRI